MKNAEFAVNSRIRVVSRDSKLFRCRGTIREEILDGETHVGWKCHITKAPDGRDCDAVVAFRDEEIANVQKKFVDIEHIREEDVAVGKDSGGNDIVRKGNAGAFSPGDRVVIQQKIDGANASVSYNAEDGKLEAFSRTNLLDGVDGLRGFKQYVETRLDPEKFKDPDLVFFGEWLVPHTCVYDRDRYQKWYVYDVWSKSRRNYLPQDDVRRLCSEKGLTYVEPLYDGPFLSWDHVRSFMHANPFGKQQEGCFRSQTKILMSDCSLKCIKDIKVGDYVKSYNYETNKIEDRKVINVFFNGSKPLDEWMTITVFPKGASGSGNIGGQIVCTKNHKFFNGKGFSDANKIQSVYHYGKVMDHYRKQAFLGMLCSDGHYCKRDKNFKFSQKTENIGIFKTLFDEFLIPYTQKTISGKGSDISTIYFKRQYVWPFVCDYITDDNSFNYVKAFSDLDDVGWAYFFIGDGSYHLNTSELIFGFESFSLDEFLEIKRAFCSNFNVENCSIYTDKRVSNGCGKNIRVSGCTAKSIAIRISEYIHEPFRYKLEHFKNVLLPAINFPNVEYGICKRIPHAIRNSPPPSLLKSKHKAIGAWDLEIDTTHTYFANGCLVHNCVIKNQTKLSDGELRFPKYLKIVNEEFKESARIKPKKEIDPEKQKELDRSKALIASVVTETRVRKQILKLVDEGAVPADLPPKCMGTVMKRVPVAIWNDILKEEIETVRAAGESAGKFCSAVTAEIARKLIIGK